jgi:hypothetical protein
MRCLLWLHLLAEVGTTWLGTGSNNACDLLGLELSLDEYLHNIIRYNDIDINIKLDNKTRKDSNKEPEIQKLCSFSRAGSTLLTSSTSPVVVYISITIELSRGGWLHESD